MDGDEPFRVVVWSLSSVAVRAQRQPVHRVCGTAVGVVYMYLQVWQRINIVRVLRTFRKHVVLKWFNFTSFKGTSGCMLDLRKPGLVAIRYTVLFSTQTIPKV